MKLGVSYKIRRAEIEDIESIAGLLKFFSDQRLLLPKSIDDLYRQIRGFRVAVTHDSKSGEDIVIGSAHLDIFTENLAEVKSLAVNPDYHGLGVGRVLVEDCEREAVDISIKKVFALTYQVDFFKKLSYELIDIDSLPEKVFKECIRCPFYGKCNENALIKFL
ncbi:MAG: N-acetyltransferase [Candidatus Caenarcaniphilales bacterium]|nr:N-acetyltransferase [Candidatus Caenarcaniphilales bacterium]